MPSPLKSPAAVELMELSVLYTFTCCVRAGAPLRLKGPWRTSW